MISDFSSCLERQEALINTFSKLKDASSRYQHLIEVGRRVKMCLKVSIDSPKNLVRGCQSEVFLSSKLENGKVVFEVFTEALISAGLLGLLLEIYQGESPETILKCPPSCFEKLGIFASLSPARSNGLASIYLRMQQEALAVFSSI